MTNIPTELFLTDAINLVALTLGGILLIRFFLRVGSPKSKKYGVILGASLIAYALVHEGMELVHKIYDFDAGYPETIITTLISFIFLAYALALRKEVYSIIFSGVEKNDE